MENGERSAIEVLSKLIDLAGRVGSDSLKGTIAIGSKSISAYVKNKENIVVGENDIKKLRNSGEPLNVTKIDSSTINRLSKACEDFGVPISIVKDNDENFMFYKQSDSKLVQMVMERILEENLEKNQINEIPSVKKDIKLEVEEQLLFMKKENTVEIMPKDLSTVVYDKKEITVGKQDFSKLKNSKEPISVVIMDKTYSDKFEGISKELKIPMTITKNHDNHFMMLKEKDLGKFQEMATKTLNFEKTKDIEVKNDISDKVFSTKIDKTDITNIKKICKDFGVPISIIKENGENFLYCKESDSKFVQSAINEKSKSYEIKNEKTLSSEEKGKEKNTNTKNRDNPKNNIRTKVREAEERLNTPSVEKTLDIVKDVPIAKPVER